MLRFTLQRAAALPRLRYYAYSDASAYVTIFIADAISIDTPLTPLPPLRLRRR